MVQLENKVNPQIHKYSQTNSKNETSKRMTTQGSANEKPVHCRRICAFGTVKDRWERNQSYFRAFPREPEFRVVGGKYKKCVGSCRDSDFWGKQVECTDLCGLLKWFKE